MSIDEQVHAAPSPPAPSQPVPTDGATPPGDATTAAIVLQSAAASFTVVGNGITTFMSGARDWSRGLRPGHTRRPKVRQSVPGTPEAVPAAQPADSVRQPVDTPAAAVPADGVLFPTVGADGRPVRRPLRSDKGIERPTPVEALRLPGNPAAPRPRLPAEDARPLVVKVGTLFIGAMAGAAAIVMVIGALVPRAIADVRESVELDVILPESANFAGLEQPSRVYAADGTLLAELRAEVDRDVVPLEDIPEHMRDAVIAAEDRTFYEHKGYSIKGIGRAAMANFQSQSVSEGGSTLTQQLAKKNFLTDEQTLDRKVSELFYAMKLEEDFTKDQLLERYLNEVYFGVSAYGVQAAAQEYYGVDVQELRVDQAALIAGVIPLPSVYNPRSNPQQSIDKRDEVLQDMYEIGAIDAVERDAAQARPVDVIDHVEQQVREPYVVAAVKRLFLDDTAFGATRAEREDKLFRGNLDITTTLDPALQSIAEETINDRYANSDGPTASIATVDPKSGAIVAFASGQEFDSEQFDYALQGRQQPGSAFKTFVLASALRQGFSPELTLDGDSPVKVVYDGGREYEPSNYGDADYGEIDMATALRKSVNTYFVQLFELTGREEAVEFAGELGIDVQDAIGSSSDYGPSLVLGGLKAGLTPVEMAGAYAAFANGGVFHRPYLIERVVDGDGTELLSRGADEGRAVLSPEINSVVVDIMRDVTAPGGTAPGADFAGWQTAGKTGTTNDNTDAWFAGYTPALSTAVWVGYPDEDVSIPGATGGSTAAPLWNTFMRKAHEGREVTRFPEISVSYGQLFRGEAVKVPSLKNITVPEALIALAEAKLIGRVVAVDSPTPRGTVLGVSPGSGATVRQGDRVTLTVSTGVAPPPPKPKPTPEPAQPPDTATQDPAAPGDETPAADPSGGDDGAKKDADNGAKPKPDNQGGNDQDGDKPVKPVKPGDGDAG